MDNTQNKDIIPTVENSEAKNTENQLKPRRHLIGNKWVRRLLKTLLGIIIIILLIPVALYIPPVQTFVKNVASKEVKKATGMDIRIGEFRLKFPLDVSLKDVLVIEATGDTMVRAQEVIADVKIMPLLKLDVKLNRLQLREGYYRMVAPDTTMILKINAGLLEVDDKSSANLANNEIMLNKAVLKRGKVELYMDVWKEKAEQDTTVESTPFLIKANDLHLEDFTFAMSMLPTIDTMYVNAKDIRLENGVVDLAKNNVTWKLAKVSGGNGQYLVPDPEWVKLHPAPPTEPSSGPPMVIKGDSIALDNFNFLYATKGVTPVAGLDPAYMQFSDIAISMKDFYNESANLNLPITRLQAKERSGLEVTGGSGLVAMDSTGLKIRELDISTLYSSIRGSADLPFALMELQPDAEVYADIAMRLGMPDLDAAVPMVKTYTAMLPARTPLEAEIFAEGSLASVDINKLNVTLRDVISLQANGYADNPLDIKKLVAEVEFDGKLSDPRVVNKFTGMKDISVPAFRISGEASAKLENYAADFHLESTAGDVAGNGRVSMNSEKYNVDLDIIDVNVAKFLPDLGVGVVAGNIQANGSGFNPLSGKAVTDITMHVDHIEYNKRVLRDIVADVKLLPDGSLDVYANSNNKGLNFAVEGTGLIKPDDYTFDIEANLRDIDLKEIGVSPELNNGNGIVKLRGSAMPDKWIYDVTLNVENFDWNLPNQYIHLPGGVNARFTADAVSTRLDMDSYLTGIKFDAEAGLQNLIGKFTDLGKILNEQISARRIDLEQINSMIPAFNLELNASGNGLLSQFLVPQGFMMDTIYGKFGKDSLLNGGVFVRNFSKGTLAIDTINFNMWQNRELLNYAVHIGNRPGTLDEFATANLDGYISDNRVSAKLTQHNIKGETGYDLGITAALQDSIVTLNFTPLESMIAYMPWTFNKSNFVNYNLLNRKVDADLEATSAQSAIVLKTQPTESGLDELLVKLENIRIQDFTNMIIDAPPVAGAINSDLHIQYDGKSLQGQGNIGVSDLTYERSRIGDFVFDVNAGLESDGHSGVNAALSVNGYNALNLYANLRPDSVGLTPDSIGLRLDRFPINLANSFLAPNASLGGYVNGEMRMDGDFTNPVLNGHIQFEDAFAKITMADAILRLDTVPVTVTNSLVEFNDFDLISANNNPICIDGTVDLRSFTNILLDMKMKANNCQLIKSDNRSKADIFGKLFVNLDGSAKGSLDLLDIRANLNILGTTDITYRMNVMNAQATLGAEQTVVKFVNFNDSAQVSAADSLAKSTAMRIRAGLTISPGTEVTVLLTSILGSSSNGTDRVELQPTANLNYFQNYMGDMKLNGKFTLGNGFARYSIPVIGEKMFTFDPSSSVTWTGDIMNPILNIKATDDMKVNVSQGSGSQMVNFLVTLNATGKLTSPQVSFDLATNDDISIQNELQSMSKEQRQSQAMNLLITGQYSGQNSSTKVDTGISGKMLYGYLASQLNSWAAKTIRGVDLSFGVDQYDSNQNGSTSTATSYSYQVSKSLFNNRFKIQVGGNYSTDASADENLSQNLVSDITMEYMLKQTENVNMSVRIFRHTGYESILEGEITETGAGFQLKRKLSNLLQIFRFGTSHEDEIKEKKERNHSDNSNGNSAIKPDSVPTTATERKEGHHE